MVVAPYILAQTDTSLPEGVNVAENTLYGVITYVAERGGFEKLEGERYRLILEDVDDIAPYWLVTPTYMPLPVEIIGTTPVSEHSAVGGLVVPSMVNAWRQEDAPLQAEAWLSIHNMLVRVFVSQPDYFPETETLVFNVDILDIIGSRDGPALPPPPPTFRDATLSMTLTNEFIMGLDIGLANAIGAFRLSCEGTPRQQAICSCKRDADREAQDRNERIAMYEACNAMEFEEGQNGEPPPPKR